jgi:hypothetical protein
MDRNAKGLNPGLLDSYDSEREEMLAGIMLAFLDQRILDQRISAAPRPVLFGSTSFEVQALEFRKRLIQFALSRRIPLANPQWEYTALKAAATEHPDLQPIKKRGRPVKKITGGLVPFSVPSNNEKEARDWVKVIDEKNKILRRSGKKIISDRKVAQALARQKGGGDSVVAANTQVFANRISGARAALARPKRPTKKV